LSGIAARRMRPDRVSRYFAPFRLGLAWLVPRFFDPVKSGKILIAGAVEVIDRLSA
jgi:hypothetical protein